MRAEAWIFGMATAFFVLVSPAYWFVSGDWTAYWVYVVGPVAGAIIAVGCAFVLRGRGGDAIARAAGSGVLAPGRLAAKQKLSQDIDRGTVAPPGIADTDGH